MSTNVHTQYDSEGYPIITDTCIDCGTKENVEMRYPGYGHKNFPRCEVCGDARVAREQRNKERYMGAAPPSDFSEDDAGEAWDEEDIYKSARDIDETTHYRSEG